MRSLLIAVLYCFLVPNIAFSQDFKPSGESLVGIVRQTIAEQQDQNSGEMIVDQIFYDLETKSGLVPLPAQQDLSGLVNQLVEVRFAKSGVVVTPLKKQVREFAPGDLNVPPPTLGARKTLVLMVNFQGAPTPAITEDHVRNVIFTGANSANSFFQDASLNRFWLNGNNDVGGDVHGWIQIPFDNSNCNTNMFNAWTAAADDIAAGNGFSKTQYPLRMYMFPIIPGCQWTAVATVGILGDPNAMRRSWFQLRPDPDLLEITIPSFVHEIGHMVGLGHSNGQTVEGGPISDGQEVADFMGRWGYLPHNINRKRLGWLSGRIQTLNQPITITTALISPAVVNKVMYQGIRIPLKDASGNFIGKSIWLEARKNMSSLYEQFIFNHQAYVTGIAIRYVEDDLANPNTKPVIRDTTPGSPIGFNDAPLQLSTIAQPLVYNDPTYGVTVELIQASNTLGDRVKVTLTR